MQKVEDLTLDDCIEECLIGLDLGKDKFKGKLFEIDLTRYFCLHMIIEIIKII